MRLFLLFLTAVAVCADHNTLRTVTRMKVFGGPIPDGSLMTFYFKHVGSSHWDPKEPVAINFYDLPSVEYAEMYDITAHIRLDRTDDMPVGTASFVKGSWMRSLAVEQPMDPVPPSEGWWRLDVYKHDKYRMNVFFQGFWSGVRTFEKSLDNVRSIYITPEYVDHDNVVFHLKLPNDNVPPMSVDKALSFFGGDFWKADAPILDLPNFPIGTHIEMTTVLRASGGMKYRTPGLFFDSQWGAMKGIRPLKIMQLWEGGMREQLWITNTDMNYDNGKNDGTLCTNERPHGDLQHLYLERKSSNKLMLQVFYKPSNGEKGVWCEHTVSDEYARVLDQPFTIYSQDGEMIFHLDHSIPRTVVVKDD